MTEEETKIEEKIILYSYVNKNQIKKNSGEVQHHGE
jgi:hypothetical protein